METIKTAISIDATTFKMVGRLTKKLHISRSRFFTQAARYMVEKDENLELIKKINAAYDISEDDSVRHRSEKAYARKKIIEKW